MNGKGQTMDGTVFAENGAIKRNFKGLGLFGRRKEPIKMECCECYKLFPEDEITKNRGFCNACLHKLVMVWENDKEYV